MSSPYVNSQPMSHELSEESVHTSQEVANMLSSHKKKLAIREAMALVNTVATKGRAELVRGGFYPAYSYDSYGNYVPAPKALDVIDIDHFKLVQNILKRRGFTVDLVDFVESVDTENPERGWRKPKTITKTARKMTLTVTLSVEKKPNLP